MTSSYFTKVFRDDYDKMKDNGLIVEVKDGYLGVFFSNCGLKGDIFFDVNDDTIVKSEIKTLTATIMESAASIGEPVNKAAQFQGIGASCED